MGRSTRSPATPQLVVQPFLEFDFPSNGVTIDDLRTKHTFAHTVYRPLLSLHESITTANDEREKTAKIAAFLDRFFGEANAESRMQDALERSESILRRGLDRYVPPEHRSTLGLREDEEPGTLEGLISNMFSGQQDEEARRRAFLARRRFYLIRFLLQLDGSSAAPFLSGQAANRALELLKEVFLRPEEIRDYPLFSLHDLENAGRCLDARLSPPPTRTGCRESRVLLRKFRDLTGQERPILCCIRLKDPFAILIRMLRDELHQPEHVPDLRGIRFVCFSHEDRIACLETLLDRCPSIESTADDWVDLYSGTAVRLVNRFSARYFRVLKFAAKCAGSLWEFQIMHVHDFLNLWYSEGEENWHRYRLRQLFALFFPQFFPRRHFGLRWRKDHVRRGFNEWATREPRVIP